MDCIRIRYNSEFIAIALKIFSFLAFVPVAYLNPPKKKKKFPWNLAYGLSFSFLKKIFSYFKQFLSLIVSALSTHIFSVWLYFLRKYLIPKIWYNSCFRNLRSSSWFIVVQFEALSDLIVMHHWRTSTNCTHQLILGLVLTPCHYLIRLKDVTVCRESIVFQYWRNSLLK